MSSFFGIIYFRTRVAVY